MHIRFLRHIAVPLLSGAILTFSVGIASACFLQNLGWIIGSFAPMLGLAADTAQTLSEIFAQLRSASLNLPLAITGAMCFLFSGLAVIFLHFPKTTAGENPKAKKGRRIVTVCVLGVVFFLLLTAATIWFTEVNDIRFGKVMVKLVSLLKAGIL